ncbi:MAG: hypothetical protein AAF846_17610 [Chloroflexota bacterium]
MIQVYWDDDTQTIIRLDFSGKLRDWAEYHDAVTEAIELAEQVTHPCYLIFNANIVKMPQDLSTNPLSEMKRTVDRLPKHIKGVITVIENGIEKRLVDTAPKIFIKSDNHIIISVNTLEMAYDLINAQQSSYSA